MKTRALIDGAPFGPETGKAIGEAFDQASARINSFGNDPNAIGAARIRFAEATGPSLWRATPTLRI
jgi:hypothetical protein